MRMRTFTGDFFEIGRQQGAIYRRNGMRFKKPIGPLFRKQLLAYQTHYPEMLDEFRGMADGGSFDVQALTYTFICDELLWFAKLAKACTIFGVRNRNGAFVGRNYDWLPATERFFQAYRVKNTQRHAFVAVTDMGIVSPAATKKYLFYNADDAINDQGLFIGINFAYHKANHYGLSCIHMTKLIAETCATVDDALRIFKKVPLCYPKNFFIADRSGDMAVVEHTSRKYKIVRPNNGVLVKTNHFLDPQLAKEDTVLEVLPTHNTFRRYSETLERITAREDAFRLPDVIRILGDTQSCVCQNLPNVKTVWSLALDLKKKQYRLYWNLTKKRKEAALKI